MNTGAQDEHKGQEPSQSATPAGGRLPTAEQQTGQKEVLPAEIIPAPGLPEPAALEELLLEWVRTPDWPASKDYVEAHPELLSEAAEQVLKTLSDLQPDQRAQEILTLHQQLLQAARQHGVEATYEPLMHQKEELDRAATAEEDLEEQVITWLQSPDWETSQTYLQTHPQLLTDATDQLLEALKQAQSEEHARTLISIHQAILQEARTQGIEAAYKRFLASPQEELLSEQEQEDLLQQLEEWISFSDWEHSQAYLEAHPRLLTSAAETLLGAMLYQIQQTDQASVAIILHQHLLRTAREQGIADAYRLHSNPVALNAAGLGMIQQYLARGQIEALNRALSFWQEALLLTPEDSPNRPTFLNHLGHGLLERYAHTGDLADLEAAIQVFEQVVQATPPDSLDRPDMLHKLGNGLRDHYTRTGDLADLERAIYAYQQAVQATPPDSPDRPEPLNNLGWGLHERYARAGDLADLEAAIQAFEQAVQATPLDSPDRSRYLSNLGVGLLDRYTRTGDLADLEAAISACQQAVQATRLDSPDRSMYLSYLGGGLNERYARTGDLADLEAAIQAFEQAVQAAPPDSPDRSMYLSNLGGGLRDRYARTGDLADLEAAIQAFEQAVQATPLDSLDRPRYLSNLGGGLNDRYTRTGDLADFEAAIQAFEQAVQATPPDSPDRSMYLSNLGGGLNERYARTGDLADLEAAIQAFEQAVQATPPDAPDRSMYLSNLGNGLRDRYTRTGDLADLERAIHTHQQAVQATAPDSPDRPVYLNNLGNGLRERYARTGDLTDLDATIEAFEQAVQTTLPDAPNRSRYLGNLGYELHNRYARTRELVDLEAAITSWEGSWSAPLLGLAALPVAYQLGQQRHGASIAASLVTGYLERATQEHQSGPGARHRALEIVEGSKSRLLTQLVGRGPLPVPAGSSPQIAERERQLLADLTTLDTQELASHNQLATPQEITSHLSRLQQRQATLSELEDLWRRMARLGAAGREYVALRRGEALTWRDLMHLANQVGPNTSLLSFFMTAERTLLFLLGASWRLPRVVEVPLNEAGWDDLLERFFREVHRYTHGVHRGETWDNTLRSLLEQAHQHVVGIERLILAPAGNGHLLPWSVLLEHAGWRTPTGHPLPLVTLPALGVLPRLRQRPRTPTGPTLVIGNPFGDLPFAESEARKVAERFDTTALLGEQATKAAVLPRLADAFLVHLATHAFFDPRDPLDSGIVLADGILTAREILEHRLQADLLVLSACQSGQVGSLGGEELAGLSQAFLQAGVRSLLVSLWAVNDPATAALMQAFYDAREHGADKALALRQAMTQIQQDPRWSHPYYWGAFVLMGDWE